MSFVQPALQRTGASAVKAEPKPRPGSVSGPRAFGCVVALAFVPVAGAATPSAASAGTAPATGCPSVLQHRHAPLLAGKEDTLCRYAGQVALIVNTASQCGYTEQYRDLQRLYDRYKARGFVILGFPANAFGQQEPGSNKQIAEFCEANFGVRFPMFGKIEVTPITREPLFAELARRTGTAPGWNFHKYLVSRDGTRILSFTSGFEPLSPALTAAIERELAAR